MKTSIDAASLQRVLSGLTQANAGVSKLYPGERPDRQPVHTVYGGAQLFKAETAKKLGVVALKALTEHAPTAKDLSKALAWNLDPALASTIYDRIVHKLKNEPVEDFRIDFEDGYGNRPAAEEDGHAESAAKEVARGIKEGILSPFIGIRIKPLNEELKMRSLRTLDIFVSTLVSETQGKLPANFVITLPKVTSAEQISALVELLPIIEQKSELVNGSLKMEMMVEVTQSIFTPEGKVALLGFVEAAKRRCVAAHFGTYDYTASCDITAAYQAMDHASCDFAKSFMKVALGSTGLWLSDGATNVMPVGNRETVHRSWKIAYDHIRHSLKNGFYQGWDLHPGQLPIRYAAVYSFFLEGLDAASKRLKSFMDKAAQATLLGDVFDDAATGQGLLNYFLRALNCGAITVDDVAVTGLTLDEIRTRSFSKIIEARRLRS